MGVDADPESKLLRRKMRIKEEKKKLGLSLRSILELCFVWFILSKRLYRR